MQHSDKFHYLRSRLDAVTPRERSKFRRSLAKLERRLQAGKPVDHGLARLDTEIEVARDRVASRREALPRPQFPDELPIVNYKAEISKAIVENQVVIVCGDTGSGKSTQLPKICLELGYGAAGLIGHTQPRRIAARSVASRVADELDTQVGSGVGYKVRFSDQVGDHSYLKLMTDGMLLAEIQNDRFLTQYEILIIDEAHERSLNIDFLLGYLTRLLPQRPDLKVIITSATIDPDKFSRHFANAPVYRVEGRSYPVEVRYQPLIGSEDNNKPGLADGIINACKPLLYEGTGDILVFLPGEREIREASRALGKSLPSQYEILPLYSRLSNREQNRVFAPHTGRRIILATNVAETSITVPGIRYVVDAGLARISRYSWRSKLQRLPVEAVSKASADQRKGRCGRVGPGVCIRLYGEEDFNSRPEFTDPEIQRTNLASVILQMKFLGLGEIEAFPFIDPPDSRLIRDGHALLTELHAIDSEGQLTRLGRRLAQLPVDPRLGRMLLAADRENALHEVLVIAAALSIQDPREFPADHRPEAQKAHQRFFDKSSDFLSYLNLWNYYHETGKRYSRSKLRKICGQEFLSWARMREWVEIYRQLQGQMAGMGFKENKTPAGYEAIHRSLLTGLLSNIGLRLDNGKDKKMYLGARNRKYRIHFGSNLHKTNARWIIAAELLETEKTYARNAAQIKPEWVLDVGAHLLKHHIYEPHWEKRSAQVKAYDQISIYGLIVNARKRVRYADTHPEEAREIFIFDALVHNDINSKGEFLKHNQSLISEIEELESKNRRPDLLVDEQVLFQFYDRLLPGDINNGKAFEKWRRQMERDRPKLLFYTKELLMREGVASNNGDEFPDKIEINDQLVLPLSYRLEPGNEADGVTATVPVAALEQVDTNRCDWLVPGLLEEKIEALIRGLPKSMRKNFVPVTEFSKACNQALEFGQGNLTEQISAHLRRMTGVVISSQNWALDRLPDHLRMRFRVIDANGSEVDAGRDYEGLVSRNQKNVRSEFKMIKAAGIEKDNVVDWDFGDLPDSVEVDRQGFRIQAYPSLSYENGKLSLRLFSSQSAARDAHRSGLLRLLEIKLNQEVKYVLNKNRNIQAMCRSYADIGSPELLKQDFINAVIEQVCLADSLPRTETEFKNVVDHGKAHLVSAAHSLSESMSESLLLYQDIIKAIKGSIPLAGIEAIRDIEEQLSCLVYPGFIQNTPMPYREHMPRYLKAIKCRLDKLKYKPEKDRRFSKEIAPLWTFVKRHYLEGQPISERLKQYRWLLEELRVSLFAQELGTAETVSVTRLEKERNIIERDLPVRA